MDLGYGLKWPRLVYGRALRELNGQQPKAVAFDVLFAELRKKDPQETLPDGSLMPSDEFLASQLSESGYVILGAEQDLLPARLFRNAAWKVGDISTTRDPDGVLRRARAYQDYPVWHFIIEAIARQMALNLGEIVGAIQPGDFGAQERRNNIAAAGCERDG